MAKSVAEYNAEIKKLQDERNKVIADEKAEIIKGLKEQIGTYMIKSSELFSKTELGGTDAQPAVEVKERSERRTKEQIEADAKAKLEKKLVDAQAAFNAKTVVYIYRRALTIIEIDDLATRFNNTDLPTNFASFGPFLQYQAMKERPYSEALNTLSRNPRRNITSGWLGSS